MADAYEANLYSDEENNTKNGGKNKGSLRASDQDVNDSARIALN